MMYYLLVSLFLVIFAFHFGLCARKGVNANLPPRPAPLPFIGTIMDLSVKGEPKYQHWLRFKDKYSPISSITILGQTIIILHNKQATLNILEKEAFKSLGRPYFTFSTIYGFHYFLSLKQYNSS